jgi:hypothetical protein
VIQGHFLFPGSESTCGGGLKCLADDADSSHSPSFAFVWSCALALPTLPLAAVTFEEVTATGMVVPGEEVTPGI